MPKAELITQAEYARRRGCDPTSVRDAVKAGRITLIDGKIDPAVADVQWSQNTRARGGARPTNDANLQAPAPPGDGDGDYWSSRARREKAEADMAELKLGEQMGNLLRADEVRNAQERVAAAIDGALEQLAPRLAPVVAAKADLGECQLAIEAEVDAMRRMIVSSLSAAA